MKLSVFLLLIGLNAALAQDPEKWQAVSFATAADYKVNEATVLECANFILDVAAEPANPARKSALAVLSKWMAGTPDHTFVIGPAIGKLMSDNEAVLGIYMAAMTKYVLERDTPPSEKDIELNAFTTLLEYCEDPRNKVPGTRELKRALKARDKGKLTQYLSS
ncbi:MAG TPA: hypothetical protein VKZ86_14400 [Cyclobacteriaceae bacterium]|nr:hypothetical protein [Cyclobacteriaceae bacterium]